VTASFQRTIEVLIKTRNEAVTPLCIDALESSEDSIFIGALQALVGRRNKGGHLAVLKRWHRLTSQQRSLVMEGRGRMSAALRDAVLSKDTQLFENASEIVEFFQEFDLIPTLITLAENHSHAHASQATALVHKMVERLSELLLEGKQEALHRDPEILRQHLLDSLERSVERFRYHKQTELLEAFLILCGPSSLLLLNILDDPHHPCFNPVLQILTSNTTPAVMELLLQLLIAEAVPLTVLNIVSSRTDHSFVRRLLAFCNQTKSSQLEKNLKRIRKLSWLKSLNEFLDNFNEEEQQWCVQFLKLVNLKQDTLINALEVLLHHASPAGRLAACRALSTIGGDRTNKLVLEALQDELPEVRAAATRQLRERHIPGTIPMLLNMLDSPHSVIREAAREALAEFSLENYLMNYDTLPDDTRLNSGMLVLKVDSDFLPKLIDELLAPTIKRRLRAIEIAQLLNLVPEISPQLLELLGDSEHLVRAAAADALQHCPTLEVVQALELICNDRSAAVQHAAHNSLAAMGQAPTTFHPHTLKTTESSP